MEKSRRKGKKGVTMRPNAGDKERISNHCPPDMTDAVKTALESEIEAFKKSEKAEGLARHEANMSAAGGSSTNAYEDWVENHGGQEVPEANPDVVSDEDSLKYISSKEDGELAGLLLEFRESLTRRQLQVWNLVMKHQLSLGEAAKLLCLSKHVTHKYLMQARKKFYAFRESFKS